MEDNSRINREWLNLKFQTLSNKIDESIKRFDDKYEELDKRHKADYHRILKILVALALLGSFVWIKESRELLISLIQLAL